VRYALYGCVLPCAVAVAHLRLQRRYGRYFSLVLQPRRGHLHSMLPLTSSIDKHTRSPRIPAAIARRSPIAASLGFATSETRPGPALAYMRVCSWWIPIREPLFLRTQLHEGSLDLHGAV
jgi:hypothetical protein